MIIPCVFLSGIFMWILLACGSPTGVVLFAIFFGFFSGAVSRSSYPCVALLIMSALQYISLLPSVNASFARSVHEIGIRIGTHGSASGLHSLLRLLKISGLPFAVLSIGALVGTPITGALVGNGPDFHWWKASTFSGILCVTGSGFLLIARMMQARRKGTQKV